MIGKLSRSRWRRIAREFASDLALVAASVLAAMLTLHQFALPQGFLQTFLAHTAVALPVAASVLLARRVYLVKARYISLYDFLNLGLVGAAVALALVLLDAAVPSFHPLQGVVPALTGFYATALLAGMRILVRIRAWRPLSSGTRQSMRRTLIVGCGDAGEAILREIARSEHPRHHVVGFVDDDADKHQLLILGVRVLGAFKDIPRIVEEREVNEILIAIPSADGAKMREVVAICQQTKARVRTLPGVAAVLAGTFDLSNQLRDVDIDDLLRRDSRATDLKSFAKYLGGETVLITGGGGSIGSELARQISRLSPGTVVLLGRGENSVYEIEQELIRTCGIYPTTVIADVRDAQSVERVFSNYRPTIVFHAAAHKHVPLMEENPIEAIRNNVFGTWVILDAAIRHGARKFIYVSTDKAVTPANVMGATKRVGEMIVTSLSRTCETDLGIVRFGNVLGSRGSLVPMLKAQIRRGGPVLLTHPDMTRYFMTIPEAARLILIAGSMGKNGEIFLLNMGEPIRIVDLACDLIRLHGLVPGEDIRIEFTGIRPGEKIEEELVWESEELISSAHSDIRMVRCLPAYSWDLLRKELEHLRSLCERNDSDAARQYLMELAWGKTLSSITGMDSSLAAIESRELEARTDGREAGAKGDAGAAS